ncbi:MAG: TIGR03663 family protein [Ignavibacteria bacterium]|nr:TIGR03663 family protein [Ignavibacteria bacterium]
MKWEGWIVVVALIAGVLLRLLSLDLRPMHTDEAVHAVKFGELLEHGTYHYDKKEYHGPTLNYLTLIPAWLSSKNNLTEVTETTLRIVPALCGFSVILLLFLIKGLGRQATAWAALLTACSPVTVFYSRYYIQEMLLVCFTFGFIVSLYRLLLSGKSIWAALAGVQAGLMYATKETWLISAGCMGLSLLVVILLHRQKGERQYSLSLKNLGVVILAASLTAILFFSSFTTNWNGVVDSLLAYQTYFQRAGESGRHGHPWYYFLKLLTWSRGSEGPVWTEIAILVFGLVGIWSALKDKTETDRSARDFKRFVGLYGLFMFIVSSAIPYKTPWLIVGAWQAFIVMAACAVVAFLEWFREQQWRHVGFAIVLLIIGHLAWQASLSNFKYCDDPGNPYVYAHPTKDVQHVAAMVENAARHSGQGSSMPVLVVYPGDDYWPLPWYLRSLKHVGWWGNVEKDFSPTRVILASPEVENALLRKLYEEQSPGHRILYVPLFADPVILRPGKEIRGYITFDLWEKIQKDPSK